MAGWTWFWIYVVGSWVLAWILAKMTPWMLDRIRVNRYDYQSMEVSVRLCFLLAPVGGLFLLIMSWVICVGQRINCWFSRIIDRMFRFIGL